MKKKKHFVIIASIRYIGTKSMILVMFITRYTTIRSIFSKASDLPITFERLNATTYIYATVKKSSRGISQWMFNFIYFTGLFLKITSKIFLLLF